MEQTWEIFLHLLRCAMRREDPRPGLAGARRLAAADWEEIVLLTSTSRTWALLYDAVAQWGPDAGIDPALLARWKQTAFHAAMQELAKQGAARTLVRAADARGLRLVVFKGMVLADLYPQPAQRASSDTDVWVPEADVPRAEALLADLGYEKNDKSSKDFVQVYVRREPFHAVELHSRLWEDFEGQRIQIIQSMDLTAEHTLTPARACGLDFVTLGPTEHLIYQVYHIVKHFMLEGVGIRYLVDLTLYIQRYRAPVDWPRFWDEIDRLGYRKFCELSLSICVEYLGLEPDASGVPLPTPHRAEMGALLSDLLQKGGFSPKTASWQILGMMTPYFVGEKEVSRFRAVRWLNTVFLRPQDLTCHYAYARKWKILLPVAWVHRILRYLGQWITHRGIMYNVNEKIETTEHRLRLLREVGLVEEKP